MSEEILIKPKDNDLIQVEKALPDQSLVRIVEVPKDKTIEIVAKPELSLFYELKKTMGIEKYSDTNFLLYILIVLYVLQKLVEFYKLVKGILVLPKQVAEVYNFITKEDLILLDKIDDLMQRLMGVTGADRIAIAKIHNGTYDNTGSHQMKFSVIYEVTDRLSSSKESIQNVPINYIKEEIILGSFNEYQRIERSDLDSYCDVYLDKIGIKAKDYKLLAINRVIYGIMDIHYIELPEFDFTKNKQLERRVIKITKEIEECLQTILLKRNWSQKIFSKLFKINPTFK